MKKLLVFLSVAVFACKSTTIVPLGEEITLMLNDVESFDTSKGKVSVELKDIIDSRCPIDANCVRAGEVIVDLNFNNTALKLCLGCSSELNIGEITRVGDFQVSILEVSPYPYLAEPNTAKDKVVTLKID